MAYSIKELAELAGLSTRTLRYYDEIGLLKPATLTESGYRQYGAHEVNQLQVILFYKELGVGLDTIKAITQDPEFDRLNALEGHHTQLLQKKDQLVRLIENVDKTIQMLKGDFMMSDPEKFEGFKKQALAENEKVYGKEIRRKYSDDWVDQSNAQFMNLSPEDYENATLLEKEMRKTLAAAMKTGQPEGELGQKAVQMHKEWLQFFWPSYSKEAHAGLANMYVEDERFKANYDKDQEGTAEFLKDAILIFTGQSPNK